MKNWIIVLLFLTASHLSYSQVQTYDFGRNYTDTLPDALKLDIPKIRNHVYERIPSDIRDSYRQRAAFRFSDQSALVVSNLLKSGDIYSDWTPFENYLNQIFEKVIPKDFEDREAVRIYLLKNGGFNAFMTPTGVSCVNVGLFTNINDEAALAGILAHELAHYVKQHSLKRFIKAERGEFRQGIFRKNKAASQFSIANETQADSLAMIWMEQSGYALGGMVRAFSAMKKRQDRIISLYEDVWEFKASTHPLPASRLEHLKSFEGKDSGSDFLVSEKLFKEFSKKAKPEILKHLLEGFNYDECIETAFKFHLQDSNNPAFLYYMMEAIRRSCYLRPDKWRKNFITHRYYEVVENTADRREKKKMEAHLFENFNEGILGFSADKIKKMDGAFYWDGELKFKTNEEAFDFFYRVSQLFDEPECVLSNALSITKAEKVRAKELQKYLKYENIKYRDYANSLLENSIHQSLEDKKMVVLSGFQTIVRQGDEDIPIRAEDPNAINSLSLLFDTIMMDFPDTKPVFLPDWGNYRLNDYALLTELEQFSFIQTISRGQRTELHILDPRYWEGFRRLGVNEIQFLNCIYYESRKKQKSKAAYEELITKDYLDIFNQRKRTKYLELFITAVREVENGAMKVRFYGKDNKLNFKKQGRQQIINIIKKRLEEMDLETKKMDRRFRKN